MAEPIRLKRRALKVLDRMIWRRLMLMRQSSDTATAIKGGGYVYSTHPDGAAVSPDAATSLIRAGLVASRRDDFFSELDGGGATLRTCGSAACSSPAKAEAA